MSQRPPDPDALRYARYWEPVLGPAAARLLDRIDSKPASCLDIGAGTGSLTLEAAARWPDARIVSLDASAGMLSVARERLATAQAGSDVGRVTWLPADALHMPLEDASVELALSSFVLQVVADRRALLAEACRVLRPDGRLGVVTWLACELHVPADLAYAEAVADLGLVAYGEGFRPARSTDYESLEEAADELREAGFTSVDVRADELHYTWSRTGYLEFKEGYDDHELFDELDEAMRGRLRAAVRARFASLPDADFEVSAPLMSAVARKPASA